jgi:hypothetical protein
MSPSPETCQVSQMHHSHEGLGRGDGELDSMCVFGVVSLCRMVIYMTPYSSVEE